MPFVKKDECEKDKHGILLNKNLKLNKNAPPKGGRRDEERTVQGLRQARLLLFYFLSFQPAYNSRSENTRSESVSVLCARRWQRAALMNSQYNKPTVLQGSRLLSVFNHFLHPSESIITTGLITRLTVTFPMHRRKIHRCSKTEHLRFGTHSLRARASCHCLRITAANEAPGIQMM